MTQKFSARLREADAILQQIIRNGLTMETRQEMQRWRERHANTLPEDLPHG